MKIKKIMLLIFILILISLHCDTTEPPQSKASLTLTFEDVSCTEAWLTLKATNIPLPTSVVLKQNEQTRATINLTTADTLLYIDSLLPNQVYKFHSVILRKESFGQPFNQTEVRSNELSVTTMDTTSHNFTWQTFTFGQHSSSVLYDVAIIDENNIWAVGEIYMKDSLGNNDPNAYNAVHWDGQSWELKRIYTYSSCNAVDYAPLKAIWAFSDTNIVVTSGGSIGWYNGKTNKPDCSIRPLLTGSINKLWGSSSEDVYVVGNNGNIAHYQNGMWTKIESGTEIKLTDIYGTEDGETIWVCGWDYNHPGTALLEIKNRKVRHIWDGLSNLGEYVQTINSVWASKAVLWSAGAFVFRQSILFSDVGHLARYQSGKLFEPGNGVLSLRGTGNNNVYIGGDLGMLWHYNGFSWNKYEELYGSQLDRRINGIAVKENVIVAVGWKNSDAWIAIGKK